MKNTSIKKQTMIKRTKLQSIAADNGVKTLNHYKKYAYIATQNNTNVF